MKQFNRDNLDNKKNYYRILIILELLVVPTLFYFHVNLFLILFLIPILLIDIYSNKRCLNRQKNFIKSISFSESEIICTHLNDTTTIIPYKNAKFSIREKKFEEEKTEIEIKQKKALRSKLIGRLHIQNWSNLFEIKNELITNAVTQIKYRPEGFWSKYGVLTADIVITGTAMLHAELAESSGDFKSAQSLNDVFMPISEIKDTLNPDKPEDKK